MLEKFLEKASFESYEDFMQNFKINVPQNFNFGYDVVDAWAEKEPNKKALANETIRQRFFHKSPNQKILSKFRFMELLRKRHNPKPPALGRGAVPR